jgi:hypothetical protein
MFRPFTVARWGMYLALAATVMSVWLGQRAGASLDYTLLRGVFVFVAVTALALGAEALLSVSLTAPAANTTTESPAPDRAADE